jgi:hypothetical protein
MERKHDLVGSLEQRSVPQVLFSLHSKQATGLLILQRDAKKRYIFLERGRIIAALSTEESEQIGHVLVTNGILTASQRNQALQAAHTPAQESSALLRLGLVTDSELRWWSKVLARDIISELFHWRTGYYKFLEGRTPPHYLPRISLDTLKTIQGTVRRINDISILRSWLGSLDLVPTLNQRFLIGKSASLMKLTAHEGFVLSRIDGKTSFKDIIALSGPNKVETCKFLFMGLVFGMIRVEETPAAEAAGAQPDDGEAGLLDSIELTTEELRDLAQDLRERAAQREQEEAAARVAYLRGGKYIEDESVDLDSLKREKEQAGEEAEGEEGEESLIYIIDGEEVDGSKLHLFEAERAEAEAEGKETTIKSIEEQWDEWVAEHSGKPEEQTEEEDEESRLVEERWQEWLQLDEERASIEKQIQEIIYDEEGNRIDDTSNTARAQQLRELRNRLEQLDAKKKQDVIYFFRRSQTQSHYEVLGLSRDATDEELRDSYYRRATAFTPEQAQTIMFGPVYEQLEALYERIVEAYEVLSDPEKRAKYDEFLDEKMRLMKIAEEKKKEMAANNFNMAIEIIERGDITRSMELMRAAISLNPSEPRYYAALAEILETDPKWYWESMKNYNRCIKLEPRNADHYVRIGRVFLKMRRKALARKALERGLRFNPAHEEARMELSKLK